MTNKERFLSLCENIQREGKDDLMAWLEKSDFYSAPASTRFHGNYAGGLLAHSLNVYDELNRLLQIYPEVHPSKDTLADASIDPNANANHKDIRSFMTEKTKSEDKLFAMNKIFLTIKKQWGLRTAKQWLEQEFSKGFYLNDSIELASDNQFAERIS